MVNAAAVGARVKTCPRSGRCVSWYPGSAPHTTCSHTPWPPSLPPRPPCPDLFDFSSGGHHHLSPSSLISSKSLAPCHLLFSAQPFIPASPISFPCFTNLLPVPLPTLPLASPSVITPALPHLFLLPLPPLSSFRIPALISPLPPPYSPSRLSRRAPP